MLKLILFTSLLIIHSSAFSSPGKPLKAYGGAEEIRVFAEELDSTKTQLTYQYFYLNFCQEGMDNIEPPKQNSANSSFSFDQTTTQWTPYGIWATVNRTCSNLCRKQFSQEDVQKFIDLIDRDYRMNLLLDNLPMLNNGTSDVGVPLGFKKDGKYYINNHLSFRIELNNVTKPKSTRMYRVTGFSAAPKSYENFVVEGKQVGLCENDKLKPKVFGPQEIKSGLVFFTFDVNFFLTPKTTETRSEDYQKLRDLKIHDWSRLASWAANFVLLIITGLLVKRALGRDTKTAPSSRSPQFALLLSALVGTGFQIFFAIIITLALASLSLIDPNERGNLFIVFFSSYAFLGIIAGIFSGKMYKTFQGSQWVGCSLVTALLYPSLNLALFYAFSHLLRLESSANAAHYSNAFNLVLLTLAVSVPLVFLGILIGAKTQDAQNPPNSNTAAKSVNSVPFDVRCLSLLGGLLPFGVIFTELQTVMKSVWEHSHYHFYTYLLTALLAMAITCVLISVIISYYQLNNGNYRTWWSSFWNTGSVGLYVFAYAVFFYTTELNLIDLPSKLIYFGFMLTVSLLFTVLCGAIGFFASYYFVSSVDDSAQALEAKHK